MPSSFNSKVMISKAKFIDLFLVECVFYRIQKVRFVTILFKDRVKFKFFI